MRNALKAIGVALAVIALCSPLIFWPPEDAQTGATEVAQATVTITVAPTVVVTTTLHPGATTTTSTTEVSAEPTSTTTTTEPPVVIHTSGRRRRDGPHAHYQFGQSPRCGFL